MSKRTTIPLTIGGKHSAGNPATIPDGSVRELSNILHRPNRWVFRPPFANDGSLANVYGIFPWEDLANQATKYIATSTTALYWQTAAGTTWTSHGAAASGTRLLDSCNYRGKVYFAMDDNAGAPNAINVYDGTNLSSTPFNSTIYGRCIETFGDRVFIGSPRVTINPAHFSYDWTTAGWVLTNVSGNNITSSTGVITGRLTPTSAAASGCSLTFRVTDGGGQTKGRTAIAASTAEKYVVWRGDFRGVEQLFNVPVTLEILMVFERKASTAYTVGNLLTNNDGSRYRCTVAGTTAVGALTGPARGATGADGTVTWLNEGSDVLAADEDFVTNVTEQPNFEAKYLTARIPPRTNEIYYSPRIKFYNTANPALTTLGSIDYAFRDAVTDGDPSKRNFGQQLTDGDFYYPFLNTETATSATVNLETLVWSEIADPKSIRAANFYEPKEVAGLATGLIAIGGRLLLFKRRAFWPFVLTADPDTPILPDGPARVGAGCLHPQAMDVMDDELFFIGENEVYRMKDGGSPVAFAGDAMREEIFAKGSAWVESLSAPVNIPMLAVDQKNREVWVYTQQNKLHCFNLDTETWSVHDLPTGSAGVTALTYNTNNGLMNVSIKGASTIYLTKLDDTTPSNDLTSSSTATVTHTIIWKPIELIAPRYDLLLEEVRLFISGNATYTDTFNVAMHYSNNQGRTYGTSVTETIQDALNGGEYVPIRFPSFQMAPTLTCKFVATGVTGSAALTISRAEADVNVKRGEYLQVNATAVSASL